MTVAKNRRQFLGETLTWSALTGFYQGWPRQTLRAQETSSSVGWFQHAYRRAVIDMHIPDWDDAFLSEFDPERYADALVASRAQSIVCYCQSHVGLFNYPTQVGQQHGAFAGQNMLQQMLDCCHARGIYVQLYTSLIFDRWMGRQHPEWRIRTSRGTALAAGGRHAMLCPNSPYRDYVVQFVREICERFRFEGIRFDMTFWPSVCYCDFCKSRFDAEVGGALPREVDWLDPQWVAFQRSRERWLVEFAALATDTVRACRPEATVEHQASTFPQYWGVGVTGALAEQNDFLQGDFYGDQRQGSFVRKLLSGLSRQQPFGYETSASVSLQNHTAIKSAALLEAKACAAMADGAAFVFIDAINPIGTVNLRVHRRLGQIFDRWMPYYAHLGGDRVADVGIYYNFLSKFDMAENGRTVNDISNKDSHTEASLHAASHLLTRQYLLDVVTRHTLSDLDRLSLLLLCNAHALDEEECEAIREWVHNGGSLLATGSTSLIDPAGRLRSDFLLADVFGVSLKQPHWRPRHHYLAPVEGQTEIFPGFDLEHPAFCPASRMEIVPKKAVSTLATIHLPWRSDDPSQFSSIHSDPPWRKTDQSAMVRHAYGKGKVVYCGTAFESFPYLRETFLRVIDSLQPRRTLIAEAPACVEATLFWQPDRQRYLLSLLNFQQEMPNVPISDISVQLRLPRQVRRIRKLPDNREVEWESEQSVIQLRCPRLETLQMLSVETE